jgi:hypothetical protein
MFPPKKIVYYILEKEVIAQPYYDPIQEDIVPTVIKESLVKHEYPVYSQEQLDEWLPIIQNAYGAFGEVIVSEEEVKPKSWTTEEQLAQLESGMAQIAMQTAINTLLQGGI